MKDPLSKLTARERRVMTEAMRTGETSRNVAAALGMARRTVERYRMRAIQKLGVRTEFQLGALALQLGLYTLTLQPQTELYCTRCHERPRGKRVGSARCDTCENALRRSKYKPKPKIRATDLCNCGQAGCNGLTCDRTRFRTAA